jgi:hypothetical protein
LSSISDSEESDSDDEDADEDGDSDGNDDFVIVEDHADPAVIRIRGQLLREQLMRTMLRRQRRQQ